MKTSKIFYLLILSILLSGCSAVLQINDLLDPYGSSFFYGKKMGPLSWSSSGDKILFTVKYKKRSNIYQVNIDGSGLKPLTKGNTNDLGPVMSPDGSLIAFASMRDIEDYQADLCIMDREGRRKKVLTPGPAHDFNPVFSKDGKKIYFFRSNTFGNASPMKRPEWKNFSIYVIDTDGSNLKKISNLGFRSAGYLGVNKTNDTLVVDHHYYGEKNSLWFIRLNNPNELIPVQPDLREFQQVSFFRKLKKIDYSVLSAPQFSPDGKSLLFQWDDERLKKPSGDIYLMDIKTKKTIKVEVNRSVPFIRQRHFPDRISFPSFSPDGKKIAFIMYEPGMSLFRDIPR